MDPDNAVPPAGRCFWAVVNSHANQELVAIANLDRQEFRTYCPMVTKRVRHARRVRDISRPLFPGYLFVQINPAGERWRVILSTYGVRSVVRFGDQPGLLQDDFISSLRSREVGGVIFCPDDRYKIGEEVRVLGGAFDGIVAKIINIDAKDRLLVLMELLSRKVKVSVESHTVEKV